MKRNPKNHSSRNKQGFFSIKDNKTFNNQNKPMIQSSRNPMKTMDTPYHYKTTNHLEKKKTKKDFDDSIFDLENTCSINQAIIIEFIAQLTNYSKDQKQKLINLFMTIKQLTEAKTINRKIKKDLNSQILIKKQIVEEYKRTNKETFVDYEERVNELNENINKKTALAKQQLKKLMEVEIYVQKESRKNSNYCHLHNFLIWDFIQLNSELLSIRCKKQNMTAKLDNSIKEIRKEITSLKCTMHSNKSPITIEKINNDLQYIQRKNDYMNIMMMCIGKTFLGKYTEPTREEEEDQMNNNNYNNTDYSFEKRLPTINPNIFEKQITEISMITDSKYNCEILDTENPEGKYNIDWNDLKRDNY